MVKALVLAIVTLAAMDSLIARGQSYTGLYNGNQAPNTGATFPPDYPQVAANPAPTPAAALPAPDAPATSPGAPFVDNGWQSSPVTGCGPAPTGDFPGPDYCNLTCVAKPRRYIADVELLALRTHFSEDPLGKLGEHYELSERITLGVEKPNGIGGRIRYWSYDRTTPNLAGGSSLGADFSVVDFEGTTNFGTPSFDLTMAGGIRFADIRLDTDTGHVRSNRMPGATLAIDLRGFICGNEVNGYEWHSISGARLSILGCDWRSDNGLIAETHDDNVTAMEIYGGIECSHCWRGHELNVRLTFEAQNWRSDALGENTGIDSIGFVGPGLNMGINY